MILAHKIESDGDKGEEPEKKRGVVAGQNSDSEREPRPWMMEIFEVITGGDQGSDDIDEIMAARAEKVRRSDPND